MKHLVILRKNQSHSNVNTTKQNTAKWRGKQEVFLVFRLVSW